MDRLRRQDAGFGELEQRTVPVSALLVSVLALGVAAAGNFFWPQRLPDYFALLWLLALIPPFLLAYYRGWEGAAMALAAGMILLVGVEVGGSYLADRQVRWWVVSGVIVVLIAVSLGAGVVTERLHRQRSQALELAYADPLTGLSNRRILDQFLGRSFAAAQRGAELAAVLFDIDGFKGYNDSRGHAAGDAALRLVAEVLRTNTRATDLSVRYGGDEFLGLLPGESMEGALAFAERVRQEVANAPLAREHDITVSGGVASYAPHMTDPGSLLDAADQALYAAKNLGANRVVLYGVNVPAADVGRALVLREDGRITEGFGEPVEG